jgi:DNA-binding transcriptional regulator LsrR (DeoR family)
MPPKRQREGSDDRQRIERALKICDLFFNRKWIRQDIAKELKCSAATVGREINFALERKYVRITLHPPFELSIGQELEWLLEPRGIRHVIVTNGSARDVGHAAARFFEEAAHDHATIVLDGGHTVSHFVESLAGGDFEGFRIIPVASDPPSYEVSAYELMTRMAVKYRGARCEKLPYLRGEVLDKSRERIIEEARNADFVFLGTGSLEPGNTALEFVVHLGLSPAEVHAAHPNVECMCGYLAIDECGQSVALAPALASRLQRALEFEDLIELARSDCRVVLLASSEKKIQAVVTVLRAGLCNVLVINDELGASLVKQLRLATPVGDPQVQGETATDTSSQL